MVRNHDLKLYYGMSLGASERILNSESRYHFLLPGSGSTIGLCSNPLIATCSYYNNARFLFLEVELHYRKLGQLGEYQSCDKKYHSCPVPVTPNNGTALSLILCIRSTTPGGPSNRGVPVAGVLLGHAHSASKSICSSAALSSECKLGTRVFSSAERSSIIDNDGGLDGVRSGSVPVMKGSIWDVVDGGSWMGERCTAKSWGVWEDC